MNRWAIKQWTGTWPSSVMAKELRLPATMLETRICDNASMQHTWSLLSNPPSPNCPSSPAPLQKNKTPTHPSPSHIITHIIITCSMMLGLPQPCCKNIWTMNEGETQRERLFSPAYYNRRFLHLRHHRSCTTLRCSFSPHLSSLFIANGNSPMLLSLHLFSDL